MYGRRKKLQGESTVNTLDVIANVGLARSIMYLSSGIQKLSHNNRPVAFPLDASRTGQTQPPPNKLGQDAPVKQHGRNQYLFARRLIHT